MPASFDDDVRYQWSTSQFVGITTGFAVCVAFSVLYRSPTPRRRCTHPCRRLKVRRAS